MNPRLVTGAGVVSSIGIGREAFFQGLGSAEPSRLKAGDDPAQGAACEVTDFDPAQHLGERGLRGLDRLSKMTIVAARLALHDAALKKDGSWVASSAGQPPRSERVGAVVSNAYGSLEAISELDRVKILEDPRYINPSRFPLTVSNTAAGYVGIWEELRALNVTVSDGQCGALDAVGFADVLLEGDRASALLVGGAEALSPGLRVGYDRLFPQMKGDLRPTAARAFRLGEGAALLVLETPRSARERGAHVWAEVIGYGASFAPPRRSSSLFSASESALAEAIALALEDAKVLARQVDGVVSGVAGLPPFDSAELAAIQAAFDESSFPASPGLLEPKCVLGETLGAGGALGLLVAVACLNGVLPEAMLRRPVRLPVRTLIVTSLGYYGNAAAVVLRAPRE